MAAIAGSVFQTTFAAISFAGAGYLFKIFDKNGYAAEMKRHNKALENLAVAKEKFYENEVKQHDEIQLLRQQLEDANKDIEKTNQALDRLRQVRTITYNGKSYSRKPQLNDLILQANR